MSAISRAMDVITAVYATAGAVLGLIWLREVLAERRPHDREDDQP